MLTAQLHSEIVKFFNQELYKRVRNRQIKLIPWINQGHIPEIIIIEGLLSILKIRLVLYLKILLMLHNNNLFKIIKIIK